MLIKVVNNIKDWHTYKRKHNEKVYTVLKLELIYKRKLRRFRKVPEVLHLMKIKERLNFVAVAKHPGVTIESIEIVKSFLPKSVGTICLIKQFNKFIRLCLTM